MMAASGCRMVSLLDIMQKFQPERLAVLVRLMQGLLAADHAFDSIRSAMRDAPRRYSPSPFAQSPFAPSLPPEPEPIQDEAEDVARLCYAIGGLSEQCEPLGLMASVATIEKIKRLRIDPKRSRADLSVLMDELLGRLHDELQGTVFFSLTMRESVLYGTPLDGWAAVVKRFPQTAGDIVSPISLKSPRPII